jgi:hypothetical protein
MNKNSLILTAIAAVGSLYFANKKPTRHSLSVLAVQKKRGFVPLKTMVQAATNITNKEKTQVIEYLYTIKQNDGDGAAKICEKIIRSESGQFRSLLFRVSRNYGAILAAPNYSGKKITLYLYKRDGRNLISDYPTNMKYNYRYYDDTKAALSDFDKIIRGHNFSPLAYSGGNADYVNYLQNISTPFVDAMN